MFKFFSQHIFLLFGVFVLAVCAATAQTLSREKIKQIEQLITSKMAKDRIPGMSIAIAQDGKLIWSNGYGMADLENFVPAKATTAYRSASVGKPITATAAMQLAEKGKLDLNAPVWDYCKAFPPKKWALTSRHLLAHTGGIRHYGGTNAEAESFSTKHYKTVPESLEVFKTIRSPSSRERIISIAHTVTTRSAALSRVRRVRTLWIISNKISFNRRECRTRATIIHWRLSRIAPPVIF